MSSPTVRRLAYFGPNGGAMDTPVFTRAELIGSDIASPIIVEEYDSTIVVPPDWAVTVDGANNVLITCQLDDVHEN
jgi:N-methylhydantoinase A